MNLGKLQYFTQRKNQANFGIIPPILTFNPVRENSQVVIIYPFTQLNAWFYHVFPMISPSFHGPPSLQHLQCSSTSSSGCRSKGASLLRSAKPSAFATQIDWKTMEKRGKMCMTHLENVAKNWEMLWKILKNGKKVGTCEQNVETCGRTVGSPASNSGCFFRNVKPF